MKLDKETLTQWKEDAKKATQGLWMYSIETKNIFSSDENAPYIAQKVFNEDGIHIANACPQNFIWLIECYELLIEESVMMDERVERYEEALKIISLFSEIKNNGEVLYEEIFSKEARIAKATLEQE